MTIGAIIKKLRRERDMTQEQLAEYMNISISAVSQWECDKTAPDILQLPMLANIFDVTTDYLLGVDITNKEKAIEAIVSKACEYSEKGYFENAELILREGLRQYPISHRLMEQLMYTISRYPYENGKFVKEKKDALDNEIISIGTKLLSESNDDSTRHGAIQMLCYTYPRIGKLDEAVKLANTMPPMCLSSERLLSIIYEGSKRYTQKQANIKSELGSITLGMNCINVMLDNKTTPYSCEEMILIRKKIIEIFQIVIEDGNYGYFRQRIAWTYLKIASDYARLRDRDNTIRYLKYAKEHAIASDTEYDPEKEYTCLLFRGTKYGGVAHNITSNDSMHQLDEMNGGIYDFIRDDGEFVSITEELRQYAKKH